MRRSIAITLSLPLFLAACGPSKSSAKASLEQDGYKNVVITSETNGTFEFKADDKDGKHCTGTISIQKGMGTTSTNKEVSCE